MFSCIGAFALRVCSWPLLFCAAIADCITNPLADSRWQQRARRTRLANWRRTSKKNRATQNKQVSGSGKWGSLAVSPALADIYPMPGQCHYKHRTETYAAKERPSLTTQFLTKTELALDNMEKQLHLNRLPSRPPMPGAFQSGSKMKMG